MPLVRTVLVADDDAMFREMITAVLEDGGYKVLAALDGQDGWDRLRKEGADMAVLDLNMPRKNGLELTRLIRASAQHKDMPVLMLTIRALVEDHVSGYERGADDYLTKPFDPKMLIARVRVLERRILPKQP